MKRRAAAAACALIGLTPATAVPITLSGRAEGRAGYGTNPFLRSGQGQGSAILGFTVAPVLTRANDTVNTVLLASYTRDQYLRNYGDPDNASVRLQHTQRVNPRLTVKGALSYISASNPLVEGQIDNSLDPLAIGTRTRRYGAELGLEWSPRPSDTFSLNGNVLHGLSNRNSGFSSYDFYSGGIGYARQLSDRTQLGGRLGYTRTMSTGFPTVESYEPSITLVQRFSEIWVFSGNVGASIRRTPSLGQRSTGLGFTVSLCGTYPSTTVCVNGDRTTSASGFGGARINTSGTVRITHKLNARDTASVNASYTSSKPINVIGGRSQQVTQATGSYDHRLGDRWSVGADARFQSRAQEIFGNARAVSGTAHLRYLFGRLS